MIDWTEHGRDRMLAAYNGDLPLAQVFQRFFDVALTGNIEPLGGALSAALGIAHSFRERGFTFSDAEGRQLFNDYGEVLLDVNMAFGRRDYQAVANLLGQLAAVLDSVREQTDGARVSLAVEPPAPPVEPPTQRVEIVSMPARSTTSEIERDSSNNITSSHQVERDLVET